MFSLKVDDQIEIRLVHPNYMEDHFNIVMKNKEHLGKWLNWAAKYQNIEDSRAYIDKAMEDYSKGKSVKCFIFMDNKLAGAIDLQSIRQNHKAEIGYWLSEDYTGQGIMSKCVNRILDYGFNFLNLNKIVIRVAAENTKSAAIPQKFDFKQEGILRENSIINGEKHDSIYFGLLKSEYVGN